MTTVANVIDRVMQEHIRPATETPAVCFADGAVDDTTTSVVLDLANLSIPERGAIQPSAILETSTGELLFVRSLSSSTVTVVRGWQGTTAAAIGDDSAITIAPAVTRLAVRNAVSDEIVALYPRLWGTVTVAVTPNSTYVEVDAEAQDVEIFRALVAGRPFAFDARIVRDFPESSTGVAALIDATEAGNLTYRTAFARPTDESDTLADLYVQDDWISILVYGAAARTVAQLDSRTLSVEWVADLHQTEGSPPGTPTSVAQRLKRLRDSELDEAARRWRATHRTRVVMTDPLRPFAST